MDNSLYSSLFYIELRFIENNFAPNATISPFIHLYIMRSKFLRIGFVSFLLMAMLFSRESIAATRDTTAFVPKINFGLNFDALLQFPIYSIDYIPFKRLSFSLEGKRRTAFFYGHDYQDSFSPFRKRLWEAYATKGYQLNFVIRFSNPQIRKWRFAHALEFSYAYFYIKDFKYWYEEQDEHHCYYCKNIFDYYDLYSKDRYKIHYLLSYENKFLRFYLGVGLTIIGEYKEKYRNSESGFLSPYHGYTQEYKSSIRMGIRMGFPINLKKQK